MMHWAESHFAEYLEADPNAETSSGMSELRERKPETMVVRESHLKFSYMT